MKEKKFLIRLGIAKVVVLMVILGGVFSMMGISSCSSDDAQVSSSPAHQEALDERIAPVGQVNTGSEEVATQQVADSGDANVAATDSPMQAAESSSDTGSADGEQVYQASCFACHGTGAAGAPRYGEKAEWESRLAQGVDTLYQVAITGKGAMPPRGGRADLSDDQVKSAVDYMVSSVQ